MNKLNQCRLLIATSMLIAGCAANFPSYNDAGLLYVPAHALPPSSLSSPSARTALVSSPKTSTSSRCGDLVTAPKPMWQTIRACQAAEFFDSAQYKQLRKAHDVVIETVRIAGISVTSFKPRPDTQHQKRNAVLINLHGGGFVYGAQTGGYQESAAVADIAGMEVLSIDYRMAPEYHFPAAGEDVEAVYRELLKTHRPSQIGVFGCSAGALLAAQSIARFVSRGVPVPGAVGMFCNGAAYWLEGDSGYVWRDGATYPASKHPYFTAVRADDPLAFPIVSDEMLARFPRALLIGGTRDPALSCIVATHAKLISLGVEAQLHVWEGVGHGFFLDPHLEESLEAYKVISQFFRAALQDAEEINNDSLALSDHRG